MNKLFRFINGFLNNDGHRIFGPEHRVMISDSARIQNALINTMSGFVTIKEDVFFGHNVLLLTGEHDYTKVGRERQTTVLECGNDIFIERGVWIASNAIVIGPCRIGHDSVIGAGSIITKDIPPLKVIAGNPAKVIRDVEK